MLGAAGAAEAVVTALALKNGVIPPTIGLLNPDPECDLNYTPLIASQKNVRFGLSNSLGFGGHNASVAFKSI